MFHVDDDPFDCEVKNDFNEISICVVNDINFKYVHSHPAWLILVGRITQKWITHR